MRALVVLLAATWIAPVRAGQHPPLVDPAAAKCTTCHDSVLARKERHPPTEDCGSCHTWTEKEGKTWEQTRLPVPELCVDCHDDKAKAAAGAYKTPHPPATDACTECHDPHGSDQARLLKSPPPELCLGCHDEAELRKAHPVSVERASCTMCHGPHGTDQAAMLDGAVEHPPFADRMCDACHRKGIGGRPKLRARGADLCLACHTEMEEKVASGAVHSAVRQGKCTGCHLPHVARLPKLLRAEGSNLCYPCHPSIQEKARAKGAHGALEQGCGACHDPHRSDNPFQLLAKVPELCLECHDAGDAGLASKHLSADLRRTSCLGCHDPHGSPKPHLMASTAVHTPFEDGDCSVCHEGSASKRRFDGAKALCYDCHSEIEEAVREAVHPHGALETGECTDCHTPHASQQERLLKKRSGGMCLDCHEEQGAGEGEEAHGVIHLIGCHACHEPHGGARPKLLRREGSELCLSCHDPANLRAEPSKEHVVLMDRFPIPAERASSIKRVALSPNGRNHPVTHHRTLGQPTAEELKRIQTRFTGELSCLTCHDPHKGRVRTLFRWNATSITEVCTQCHEK